MHGFLTLKDFFERVYRPRRLRTASDRTLNEYQCLFRSLRKWRREPVIVSELSDELVMEYLDWLTARELAATTINKHLRQLKAIWNEARRPRYWRDSQDGRPQEPDIEKLPERRKTPECWSVEEIGQLVEAAGRAKGTICSIPASTWWPALILTLYDSGLRIAAAMQMQVKHLEATGIRVPSEIQKQRKEQYVGLSNETLEMLRSMIGTDPESLLFPWPYDKRQVTLRRRFKQLVYQAGLTSRKYYFHKLRATHATYVDIGGGDATEALDHSSSNITRRSYLDPSKRTDVRHCDLLPRPINGHAKVHHAPRRAEEEFID